MVGFFQSVVVELVAISIWTIGTSAVTVLVVNRIFRRRDRNARAYFRRAVARRLVYLLEARVTGKRKSLFFFDEIAPLVRSLIDILGPADAEDVELFCKRLDEASSGSTMMTVDALLEMGMKVFKLLAAEALWPHANDLIRKIV